MMGSVSCRPRSGLAHRLKNASFLPNIPISRALADVDGESREAEGIGEPVSRGAIDIYGHYLAVPLAIPATAADGALIVLTGEREAGDTAAETLTMFSRLISRELAGIQRHRDMDNLRSMVDLASNSFLILDVTGQITFANEANRGILGYGPEELAGNRAFGFVHPDDLSRVTTHFESVLQTPGVSNPIECRLQHQNGTWRHMTVTATNLLDDATFEGILVDAIDISGHRASEDALRFRALHDTLTALPNRELFIERASQALARADRNHSMVGVVFIDLDRFKQVNDLMGHAVGDAVLQTIAGRLATTLRPYDTVARFGGDEFVCLLEDIEDSHDITIIAKRLLNVLKQPVDVAGQSLQTGGSVGVALWEAGGVGVDDLMHQADIALYEAKASGRDCYKLFEPSMAAPMIRRQALESELRVAIEEDQLTLFYQPEVLLATGGLVGLEALVRWNRPGHGLVQPGAFLPAAVATGLIVPLGRWVLRQACRQAVAWSDQESGSAPVRISVNLADSEFADPRFYEELAQIVEETGVDATRLQFDISEQALVTVLGLAEVIPAIKALGISLAVDRFGAGASAITQLPELTVDTLKIDRLFVQQLPRNAQYRAVVQAMVSLAQVLGVSVTAKGIETADQLAWVRGMECDRAQGFFLGPPLPASAMERYWIRQRDRVARAGSV